MSDAAFREALDALITEIAPEYPDYGYMISTEAARLLARVLALYAEAQQQGERDQLALAEQVAEATMRMEQGRAERQGEEYGVRRIWVTSRADRMEQQDVVFLNGVKPGDRVWVTKVEEAK